jgi:Na+/melibiose symporter-like transporter
VSRSFALGLLAAWAAAAAMLYYLQPGLGATYLVASGWLAVGGAAVWALTRWPPFKRTLARRRGGPKTPGDPGPAR